MSFIACRSLMPSVHRVKRFLPDILDILDSDRVARYKPRSIVRLTGLHPGYDRVKSGDIEHVNATLGADQIGADCATLNHPASLYIFDGGSDLNP
jgi:hypothetical protein